MRPAMAVAILPLCLIAVVVIAVQLFQGGDHAAADVACAHAPAAPPTARQFPAAPSPDLADHALWTAGLETNCGHVQIELDGLAAPQTVSSFVFLARHDYWRDSPCHRLTAVRTGIFLLQCGDPTGTGLGNPGYSFGIENAPASGVYPRGTVAMVRGHDPNSNGGQFFIFYRDTTLPSDGGGYSIFGKVTGGMQVIDAIANKGPEDGVQDFRPFLSISILSVHVAELS
jgi:peptidyl-prolyl cis-trans isomerase B (cyclophilin B)